MMKPLSGRILIERKPLETKTKSGIILATDSSKVTAPPLLECTVVDIAEDVELKIKAGDVIMVEPHGISPYKDDFYTTRPDNVVGIEKEA